MTPPAARTSAAWSSARRSNITAGHAGSEATPRRAPRSLVAARVHNTRGAVAPVLRRAAHPGVPTAAAAAVLERPLIAARAVDGGQTRWRNAAASGPGAPLAEAVAAATSAHGPRPLRVRSFASSRSLVVRADSEIASKGKAGALRAARTARPTAAPRPAACDRLAETAGVSVIQPQ